MALERCSARHVQPSSPIRSDTMTCTRSTPLALLPLALALRRCSPPTPCSRSPSCLRGAPATSTTSPLTLRCSLPTALSSNPATTSTSPPINRTVPFVSSTRDSSTSHPTLLASILRSVSMERGTIWAFLLFMILVFAPLPQTRGHLAAVRLHLGLRLQFLSMTLVAASLVLMLRISRSLATSVLAWLKRERTWPPYFLDSALWRLAQPVFQSLLTDTETVHLRLRVYVAPPIRPPSPSRNLLRASSPRRLR